MAKPSLELAVEVIGADGSQTRWDSRQGADSVPQGIGWRTRRGDGFADGNVTLPRRIDRDYWDLNLLDSVVISGADGSIAYEGRVAGLPRSLSQTHSVTVQTAGWMAHTRDRKMREIYIDRDLSRWRPASVGRKFATTTSNWDLNDGTVETDSSDGARALSLNLTGAWARTAVSEMWYDAGPQARIGRVYYNARQNDTVSLSDNQWSLAMYSAIADGETGNSFTTERSDLITGTGSLVANNQYVNLTLPRRYVMWQLQYAAAAGDDNKLYAVYLRDLAVIGDHGLSIIGDAPGGVTASDAIRHLIRKYCPMLNTAGVQDTTYPIPHLAFVDGVDPYDALLEINKYHLWQLGVYENRTLNYGPVDMTDYDWEVRLSDSNVTIDLQGDSTEDLANGIVVTYTDIARGTTNTITPDDTPLLADTDSNNPVNAHGLTRWTEITLSTPTSEEAAVQAGIIALAEFNQPKGPGTITVRGHIRDRQGHYQQAWKPRYGDRVIISDHPNDRVRQIVETSYEHDSLTVTLAIDSTFKRLDAILDRQAGAIAAHNL